MRKNSLLIFILINLCITCSSTLPGIENYKVISTEYDSLYSTSGIWFAVYLNLDGMNVLRFEDPKFQCRKIDIFRKRRNENDFNFLYTFTPEKDRGTNIFIKDTAIDNSDRYKVIFHYKFIDFPNSEEPKSAKYPMYFEKK